MQNQWDDLIRSLETRPDIKGKRLSDIPELAEPRYRFRRSFYRYADGAFFLAIFNAWLAFAPDFDFWPVSTIGLGAALWTMVFAERRARALTRQLHRPAAEQMARDLMGIRD